MTNEVKTASGFLCRIDDEALDDMELLEELAAMDKGDVLVMPAVVARLLGAEEKQRLYDHVRQHGRVSVSAISTEISEIISGLSSAKAKKSLPSPE